MLRGTFIYYQEGAELYDSGETAELCSPLIIWWSPIMYVSEYNELAYAYASIHDESKESQEVSPFPSR